MMSGNTDWLANQFETMFAGKPWYGKGMLESLEAIPEERWQRAVGHQSIARLVGHMLMWRRFLIEKLRNNDDFVLQYFSPEEWPEVSHLSAGELLRELKASQTELLEELEGISELALEEKVPSKYDYTKRTLVNGVLQHDIYHLGQINLLNAQIGKGK
ncbi:DinB family protein [Neolewinella agarilytica]|uniref:DinB family protein n=1 Tax=Neolewinella agarilytica TaxID=478744 RepID=UPI0023578F75|nr:DinB family protein [Neolewinella agarilytica]